MQKESFKRPRVVLTLIIILLLLVSFNSSHCFGEETNSGIYTIRLKSLDLDRSIIQNIEKSLPAKGSNTYLYVTLLKDGKPIWYSTKRKIIAGETHFDWPNDPSAYCSMLWSPDSTITIKVFLSDEPIEAALSAGAVGVAGGAGAGALIGGTLAGLFSGGLGAPAGAIIGAAIGGAIGGTGGVTVGAIAAKDTLAFEKHFDGAEEFPISENIVVSKTSPLGELVENRISFVTQQKNEPLGANQLELQKKYLVRVKDIYLSEYACQKGGKAIEENRYYMILRIGNTSVRWPVNEKEYFSYDPNMPISPEVLVVFVNTGEETEIAIYSKVRLLKDALIFSSKVAKLDGKNWVFQGASYSSDPQDQSSKVVCETYGPIN